MTCKILFWSMYLFSLKIVGHLKALHLYFIFKTQTLLWRRFFKLPNYISWHSFLILVNKIPNMLYKLSSNQLSKKLVLSVGYLWISPKRYLHANRWRSLVMRVLSSAYRESVDLEYSCYNFIYLILIWKMRKLGYISSF